MTTPGLVGLDSTSSQEHSSTFLPLIGATDRLTAYSRLRALLRMPDARAEAEARRFREAVALLPAAEQEAAAEAEADALRHGFTFPEFQKLKAYALRAIEDPAFSGPPEPAGDAAGTRLLVSMLALHT